MEAFSLLKYWKSATVSGTSAAVTTTATTVVTSSASRDSDSDSDAGPFIDLEFAADVAEGEEHEGNERAKVVSLSPPSDELLFNGRIVEINGEDELSSEIMTSSSSETVMMTSKSGQFQVPASILRSATKLRVLMLGLKHRSKPESTQNQILQQQQQSEHTEQQQNEKKQFAVKLKLKSLKVEEVPILSLLTRASSNSKHESEASVEEKRKKKEVIEKYYLKLVKPLVSKRNQQDHENVEMKMKMKTKKKKKKKKQRLGKSKSAVVHSMMMMSTSGSGSGSGSGSKENENGKVEVAKKRDDSLLEVQDGIQGAILHCKRSFNSSTSTSREQEGEEALPELSRSVSDPTHDKTAATTVTAEETAS